jgi:hypothetical protein
MFLTFILKEGAIKSRRFCRENTFSSDIAPATTKQMYSRPRPRWPRNLVLSHSKIPKPALSNLSLSLSCLQASEMSFIGAQKSSFKWAVHLELI